MSLTFTISSIVRINRKEFGDIPEVSYNEITEQFEPVINLRGRAYAHRNRFIHKNKGDRKCQTWRWQSQLRQQNM